MPSMIRGVDFDDAEFGFKEEDKSSRKRTNEGLLKELVDKCDGLYGTMAEAISELETPRIKPFRPYKTYEGELTLGNPQEHKDAMSISVERYFKTHKATVPPASRVVLSTEPGRSQAAEGDAMEGVEHTGQFAAVKNARTYKVNDPEAPGGKRDVEFESLAKGFEYGRTAVHISESEYNITKLETTKSFTILGFIHQEKVIISLSSSPLHADPYSMNHSLIWERPVKQFHRSSTRQLHLNSRPSYTPFRNLDHMPWQGS